MTQKSIQLKTTPPFPGPDAVAAINEANQALATDFAGPDDPAALAGPFMTWADTGNMLLKRRNAANSAWVVEGGLLGGPSNLSAIEIAFSDTSIQKTAGVPNNGPSFRAVLLSDQVVANNTDTVILFNSDSGAPDAYDLTSAYSPANGQFKPTVAGYYLLGVHGMTKGSGITRGSFTINKSGVSGMAVVDIAAAFTAFPTLGCQAQMYLNGTSDYARVTTYISASGGGNAVGAGAAFYGYLVRAA